MSTTQEPLYTLPLPTTLGATSVSWVSPTTVDHDILLAAGGVDRQTHVFSIPSLEPDISDDTPPAREAFTLHGHSAPVSSVVSTASGREVLSASWDGSINLYALPEEEPTEHQTPAEPVSYLAQRDLKKRRKLETSERSSTTIEGLTDGEVGMGGWRRLPDNVFRGHKGRVGALGLASQGQGNGSVVYSGGWDGSLRGWDLETGENTVIRVSPFADPSRLTPADIRLPPQQGPSDRSILSLSTSTSGPVACGTMDRTISIYDPRPSSSTSIVLSLPTQSPVPAVKCHPTSEFTMMGVTYSGLVQIWDVRSPKSGLFSVQKQPKPSGDERKVTKNGKVLGERLLAADWDGQRVVAGGEDGEVGIWNARGE